MFFHYSLLAIGAVGALFFVIDYVRTADLKQPIARQLLVLNLAMGLLLSLVLLRVIFAFSSNLIGYKIVTLTLIAVIDLSILYQWLLMRQARKDTKYGRRSTDG